MKKLQICSFSIPYVRLGHNLGIDTLQVACETLYSWPWFFCHKFMTSTSSLVCKWSTIHQSGHSTSRFRVNISLCCAASQELSRWAKWFIWSPWNLFSISGAVRPYCLAVFSAASLLGQCVTFSYVVSWYSGNLFPQWLKIFYEIDWCTICAGQLWALYPVRFWHSNGMLTAYGNLHQDMYKQWPRIVAVCKRHFTCMMN